MDYCPRCLGELKGLWVAIPDPVWLVPGLLPTGLGMPGGRAKTAKAGWRCSLPWPSPAAGAWPVQGLLGVQAMHRPPQQQRPARDVRKVCKVCKVCNLCKPCTTGAQRRQRENPVRGVS